MTDQALLKISPLPAWVKPWVIPSLVALAAAIFIAVTRPNFGLIASQPIAIKIHLAFAVFTFGLGAVLLNSRKGAKFHRIAGWVWVSTIMIVAFSSLFITTITPGRWWFIHILSGLTLVSTPFAVLAARRHKVKLHRAQMINLYFGAMVVAGAFTFLPGRLMWQMFFGK
ncbi:MAG: DUF2306 domain-containing protein [Alphaproteobacteria bacterium]